VAQEQLCSACGAKMKASRRACLRCGEKLIADDAGPPPEPSLLSKFVARYRAPLLAGGIVVPLVTVWVTVSLITPDDPPVQPAQHTAAVPTPKAPAAEVPQSPTGPGAVSEPGFLDAGRGGTAAYTRGDFASAILRFQEAIEKNPNNLDALNNLGQALVRTGRAAEAVPYFERAIALNPTNWGPRFNLGHAYGELHDWPKAVIAYKSASQVFPDDYVTEYNLGLAQHQMGQEEEAVQTYRKAIALAPGEATFHVSLGISYERLQKPVDAIQAYEDYLALAPEAPDAAKVKSRIESLKKPS
jgi:Flp pilus assembly protein TadD